MKRLILSLFIIISLFIGADHQPAFANVICPVADFAAIPDTAGCHPFTVSFANLSTDACCYMWDFGDGSPIDSTANPTHTFFNTSATVDTVYCITLVAISSDSCTDTITKCIVVYPEFIAFIAVSDTSGCHPLTVSFQSVSLGADTCYWNFGDGSAIDTTQNPTHTFVNNSLITDTVYSVELVCTSQYGCPSDTARQDILVYPKPIAGFVVDTNEGCNPLIVTFTNLSAGYDTLIYDFDDGTLFFNDTNPTQTHIFSNPVCLFDFIYTVTLIASGFSICKDTAAMDILVHPKPVADFTVDVDTGCSCFAVTITDLSVCFDSVFWDFGDGTPIDTTTAGTLTHTYCNTTDSAIIYTLRLIVKNSAGCSDTLARSIVVYPEVIAAFAVSNTAGCNPLTVSFFSATLGADTCYWDFGDGNPFDTTQSPTHTFVNNSSITDTVYSVELVCTSQYGCPSDTARQDILVHPKPVADFTASDTIGCAPLYVTFTDSSIGALNYIWDFGDGDFDFTPGSVSHTYINTNINTDTLLMKLTVENADGCKDTLTQNIIVYPQITAYFLTNPDTAGCSPFTVNFNNQTFPPDSNSYQWDFGDGTGSSVLKNPSYTYINGGLNTDTNTVQLIAASAFSCSDTFYRDIIVFPKPVANFSVNVTSGCTPLDVTISNTSTPGATYYWDFGDGSTSTDTSGTFTHTYNNTSSDTTNYLLQLMAENSYGCRDTSTAQVVVTSLLVINVNFIDTVKTGNDGAIDITVSGGTPPYNFSWSNGAANEDIDSLTAGIYIVIVTDSSGCIDSMSIEVPNATGITETKLQNQVKLYPNPHNGKFNLSIQSKNNRKFSVYIYDVFGKLISEKKYIKENNLQIDISGQAKGIYFLKVIKDDQVSISKIICQ